MWIIIVGVLVSSWKLNLLLGQLEQGLTFSDVFFAYFVGSFFGNFLPTSIGADVAKFHHLQRHAGKAGSNVVAAIVFERLTGLILIVVIVLIGFMVALLIYLASHSVPALSFAFGVIVLLIVGACKRPDLSADHRGTANVTLPFSPDFS